MSTIIAVSHHDPNMLDLGVDLANSLSQGGCTDVGIDRHWLRGPHLRVWATAQSADPTVALARDVLRRHPSGHVLDAATYEISSRSLGTAELIPGPYLPLRPDNTVVRDDAALSGTTRLVGDGAVTLKRTVLSKFLPALASSADLGRTPAALRLLGPMTVLAGRWQVAGVRSGYLTFRSHLEDFLNLHDESGALREQFSSRSARVAPAAQSYVSSIIDQIDKVQDPEAGWLHRGAYRGPDPTLRAWSDAAGAAIDDAAAGHEAGIITEDLGPGYAETAAQEFSAELGRWTFDDNRSYSSFHQQLRTLDTYDERVNVAEFAAYRFVVNQFIRAVSVLDVTPLERYFCSMVFSEAVEAHFDTSWQELLEHARSGAVS